MQLKTQFPELFKAPELAVPPKHTLAALGGQAQHKELLDRCARTSNVFKDAAVDGKTLSCTDGFRGLQGGCAQPAYRERQMGLTGAMLAAEEGGLRFSILCCPVCVAAAGGVVSLRNGYGP